MGYKPIDCMQKKDGMCLSKEVDSFMCKEVLWPLLTCLQKRPHSQITVSGKPVVGSGSFELSTDGAYETACKEFLKGCTCVEEDRQEDCWECLKAFCNRLRNIAKKKGQETNQNVMFPIV